MCIVNDFFKAIKTDKKTSNTTNVELHCFPLSDGLSLCFRLLSQLNEKEREYQELLRNSVQRKQEQIDALRKAAATEGEIFFFNSSLTSILIAQERIGAR